MSLKEQLRKTRRGMTLWNEHTDSLIQYQVERRETGQRVLHPSANVIDEKAFLTDDANIAVLSDIEILEVFQEYNRRELPRFLLAGARRELRLNPAELKVGVLTAGGNAPGLNVIVDSIVKHQFALGTEYCKQHGITLRAGFPPDLKFTGIIGGYRGLLNLDQTDREWTMPLNPLVTDPWTHLGCSNLHALRAERRKDNIDRMAENVQKLDLDILYAIGGDGTLRAAGQLADKLKENGHKCLVVTGPKTMDNDINFTDYSFGFRTTVDNAIQMLRDFHREAETLERVAVVQLFGAGSGFVALHTAYASDDADYVLIPEALGETVGDALAELDRCVERIKKRREKRMHALLVVAEGAVPILKVALDAKRDGLPLGTRVDEQFMQGAREKLDNAFLALMDYFKANIAPDIFYVQPRHLIRATPPNGFDIDLCKYTGRLMVDTALAGYTQCTVNLWQGNYVLVPIITAVAGLKKVNTYDYYYNSMTEKYRLD
ncbi:6-phosphofructokinase [Hydrogenispora ethanolica]|jgi:6-phosphofructokinase 1|uniref:6-phosphofructokinase n=1 Tax=Hydrogenispora ethanolica TaxID=1082276 RepID=A0A4R1S7M0_HYDET|nr:6-phosphofructokinase [Hydrogenispora ethanolica]TCL75084.1 6-phosphofructokinase [Hydrogenispora ethanolica]